MIQSLKEMYSDNDLGKINKSTLNALKKRNLINENGSVTPLGKRHVIGKMPLVKQCKEINIQLNEISLNYTGRPEQALLMHFESQGYIGSYHEGGSVFTILKAFMLDKLEELNTFKSREDACNRYLEAQLTILSNDIEYLVKSIHSTPKNRFLQNLKDILRQDFIKSEYPGITIEFGSALFEAIDSDILVKIVQKLSEDPYTYRSGWPDLAIIKGKTIKFIEVKTTDKLHESQLVTIPAMREILPYEFSVYKIKRKI